jgi:hypothetical protein
MDVYASGDRFQPQHEILAESIAETIHDHMHDWHDRPIVDGRTDLPTISDVLGDFSADVPAVTLVMSNGDQYEITVRHLHADEINADEPDEIDVTCPITPSRRSVADELYGLRSRTGINFFIQTDTGKGKS